MSIVPVDDDNYSAEVRMWREDGAEIAQVIGTTDVEDAISDFANMREIMEPRMESEVRFVPSEPGQDRSLSVLHPAFGWLFFDLTDDQALDLARQLQRDVPARR